MDNKNLIPFVTEVTAIVPVVKEQTTTLSNRRLQYRMEKSNTYRYLMAAGLATGLVLHGLIRFGG
ncbi:MAG: hypothetical protein PUP92_26025, partial [Rhizonema sp. PD38]|nr:hypothetical protein [Rhizonema sp. PD38]